MHSDPIADILIRIKNAQAVKKRTAKLKFSTTNLNILKLLKENGFLKEIQISGDKKKKITVKLAYEKSGKSKIKHLKRISKPGRRTYVDKNNLPIVLNGYGLAIISTSHGIMTNKEAREKGLGGEVICELY